MTEETPAIISLLLDGKGGATPLDEEGLRGWTPERGLLWVHLDYGQAAAETWLQEASGLDEIVVEALLQDETRPRSVAIGDGLLVSLRGVNLNPGADPEDMVALRMWIERDRIVTTRRRRFLTARDIRTALEKGRGPRSSGDFLVEVADRLVERMADFIEDIDEQADALEEEVLETESHKLRPQLAGLRRLVISMRRYLAPQREAMARLQQERVSWLTDADRMRLREVTDNILRYLEDLDAARDRAAVTQEELVSRLSEQMDARMYVLSIVAAIFLPLGFVTGLLGINVGGIPGAEYSWAFALVCVMLGGIAVLELWFFRRRKWM